MLENYRGITLLNVGYKILARILAVRLQRTMERERMFSVGQAGFRMGKTTHLHILALRMFAEEQRRQEKEGLIAFVDLKKAYDSVEHWALDRAATKLGFKGKSRELLRMMVRDSQVKVITPYGLTEEIELKRGIKQGCPLSPLLFILFLEPLMKRIERAGLGANIKGTTLGILGFVDDLALVATNEETMKTEWDILSRFCKEWGMTISAEKSAIMCRKTKITLKVGDTAIPQLQGEECYKYLGVQFNMDSKTKKQALEIRDKLIDKRALLARMQLPAQIVRECIRVPLEPNHKLHHDKLAPGPQVLGRRGKEK